ncbi:MAG TPA: S8 family serine peptidase [Candidatus Saccharimonadales bacterium]|nr:S8 family serine peptidase [Candidatus Saccharimonadales bacterium]
MRRKKLIKLVNKLRRPKFSRSTVFVIAGILAVGGIFWVLFSRGSGRPGPPAATSGAEVDAASNEVLVRLTPAAAARAKHTGNPNDTGNAGLNAVNRKLKATKFSRVASPSKNSNPASPLFRWYKITLASDPTSPGRTYNAGGNSKDRGKQRFVIAKKQLEASGAIEVAEPNFVNHAQLIPNDPYYSSSSLWGTPSDLWGLKKINAASAWDQTTGSTGIVVASIDTGVDRNNPDLASNMWVNTAEIPGNGIDDDGNGYVDDYYGWDFINNDGDPMDDHGHGTHTAGTIGAAGNNGIGVVGVNWRSKIMAVKILDATGSGYADVIATGIQYAADMGARVTNNSYGGGGTSQMMDDAVKYEHDKGTLFVAAAGNSNTDSLDFNPASADYAVAVAASGANDQKAGFSNKGAKIDVAAPGGDAAAWGGTDDFILSTRSSQSGSVFPPLASDPSGNYAIARGTSMASPHVAGQAALLLAKNPALNVDELKQIIRQGADDIGTAGKDDSFGYGRINAAGSMALATTHPLTPIIATPSSRATIFGSAATITGSVGGSGFSNYKIEYGLGREPSSWSTLVTSTTQPTATTTLATFDSTHIPDGAYTFRLAATNSAGKIDYAQIFDVTIDNFDIAIDSPFTLVKPATVAPITGTAVTKNGLQFANYKLEWAPVSNPTAWSISGITLTNSGTLAVTNGQLGTWNTSTLVLGQKYLLRLTVNASNGATTSTVSQLDTDNDVVVGWPKALPASPDCANCISTVTYSDVDGDGVLDVVVTSSSNKLYAFHRDGTSLPGFPITIGPDYNYTTQAPSIVDIDGDGKPEIITTETNFDQDICYPCAVTRVYKNDGTAYPGFTPYVRIADADLSDMTPVVADLDGDGKKELISFTTLDGYNYIYAKHLDGTSAPGFPKVLPFSTPDVPISSPRPTVVDLDGDGKPEIIFGFKGQLYAFDNTGTVLPGWPFTPPLFNGQAMQFYSAVAIGDLNSDGVKDVVAVGQSNSNSTYLAAVYAVKKDGTLIPGWPPALAINHNLINQSQPVQTSPIVFDYNGDGKDDVAVGLRNVSIINGAGQLYPITTDLQSRPNVSVAGVGTSGKVVFAAPYQGIINVGDLSSVLWQRSFIDSANGAIINDFEAPLAVNDLDNNGKVELGVGDWQPDGYGVPRNLHLFMWEIPGVSSTSNSWNMFGHDYLNTGNAKGPNFTSSGGGGGPADINHDGIVNILDLSIFAANYGRTGATAAQGDLNGDGVVNILDLSILAAKWGTSG